MYGQSRRTYASIVRTDPVSGCVWVLGGQLGVFTLCVSGGVGEGGGREGMVEEGVCVCVSVSVRVRVSVSVSLSVIVDKRECACVHIIMYEC